MLLEHKKIAQIFKALADEKRIAILEILQSGEKCACDLQNMLGIAQSALSYHMKILCDCEIIESRTVGKWTHYKISENGVSLAFESLRQATDLSFNSLSPENFASMLNSDKNKKKKKKKEEKNKKKKDKDKASKKDKKHEEL